MPVTSPFIVYLPGRVVRDAAGNVVGREQPEPCPELLTEDEAVRYLRLDGEKGPTDPYQCLFRYRQQNKLRGTHIGKQLFYRRDELDRFVRLMTEGQGRARDRGLAQ